MRGRIQRRGRHAVLPIVGDALVEVCLRTGASPSLIFRDSEQGESQLNVEDRLTLRRGSEERTLVGAVPGATFDPRALAPLLEFLGATVTDALAEAEGRLVLTFSNAMNLTVTPTHGHEAWHFQRSRPGRPFGGRLDRIVAVSGTDGGLIVS